MEMIVHIGTPKSGTTALQVALHRNRDFLLEHGVIYPRGLQSYINHPEIATALRTPERIPRKLRPVYEDNFSHCQAQYKQFFRELKERVMQMRPRAVILSAEEFWNTKDSAQANRLAATLRECADSLHFIAYVRDPGDFYLSQTQQQLKSSFDVSLIRPIRQRKNLQCFMQVADKMTVSAFTRSNLKNGDITSDFLGRLFPDNAELSNLMSPRAANESISAEAMDVLQNYRREHYADQNEVHTRESRAFVKRLAELDQAVEGFTKPVLLPHIRDAVVAQAKDLPWLRETFGVIFEKIDYNKLGSAQSASWRPASIEEICPFNAARRDRLRERLELTTEPAS